MLCGMNFTTTGIEFGTWDPCARRKECYLPLTTPVSLGGRQLASGIPNSVTKATQTKDSFLVAPRLSQRRNTRFPVAETKKSREGKTSMNPNHPSPSSSTSSSSPSWSLVSPPSPIRDKDQSRRSAGPFKAKRRHNARASSSSSSSSNDSRFCGETKSDPSNVAPGRQSSSNKLKSWSPPKSLKSGNDSQPITKKANKASLEKRVRFAMDVQEQTILPDAGHSSESSSSDGSACSYIDPPPPTEPEGTIPGHARVPKASRSHRARPTSLESKPRLSNRFATNSIFIATTHPKSQQAVLKTPSTTRPPDPVVVIWSDPQESHGETLDSKRPIGVKAALKNSSTSQGSTWFNYDKENLVQYDERSGSAFRDV